MRTLAVLEFFRHRRAPASIAELSEALDMPQSSTSVLVKSLVSLNYLEHEPQTRRYLPNYRVALLGDWIQAARFGDKRLTDIMELLRADIGETVMLGQQTGAGMQYIHILPAAYRLQLAVHVGEVRPMTRSALGKVLLSRKPDAQIRAIIRRNNADEEEPRARVREAAFLDEIETIRRCGYSESRGRMTEGANTIGMMIPSSDHRTHLAIGIGGPSQRIEAKRSQIIDAMRHRLRSN